MLLPLILRKLIAFPLQLGLLIGELFYRFLGCFRLVALLTFVALIVAIWQVNDALYQNETPQLNVTSHLDEEGGKIELQIKNLAERKDTGVVNVYRLEVSESKPHIQFPSLLPGESRNFTMYIKVSSVPVPLNFTRDWAGSGGRIPAGILYYVTEDSSISYKITCEKCYTQGIIIREPKFGQTRLVFKINSSLLPKSYLPVYSWVTYGIEDLNPNSTAMKQFSER